jgi:outer membrane protein with beta-barrel domain
MKCFHYLLIISLLTGKNLSAQVFSIRAGGGLATEKSKYADPYPARAVWYAGCMADIDINRQFFFQPGLSYSLRGYHRNADALGNPSANIGYNYLSAPLLIGYKPVKNLSLLLGPEPGYMLFARSHSGGSTYNFTRNVNYRFNVDATAGAALSITGKFAIETRIVWGLTPLYRVMYVDQSGADLETTNTGRNRVLQVGLTYRLN